MLSNWTLRNWNVRTPLLRIVPMNSWLSIPTLEALTFDFASDPVSFMRNTSGWPFGNLSAPAPLHRASRTKCSGAREDIARGDRPVPGRFESERSPAQAAVALSFAAGLRPAFADTVSSSSCVVGAAELSFAATKVLARVRTAATRVFAEVREPNGEMCLTWSIP